MPDQPGGEWWEQTAGRPGRASQPPLRPPPAAPGPPQAHAQSSSPSAEPGTSEPGQPWRKKYQTSLILAAVGVVLFLVTFWLYPSTTQLPVPLATIVGIEALQPVAVIEYGVEQVSSGIAEILITVQLPVNAALPAAGSPTVELFVNPPVGVEFKSCPPSTCISEPHGIFSEKVPLTFRPSSSANNITGIAIADFFVRASSFGETFNDVNASVVAPTVKYQGSGTPTLLTQYDIPNASSYDWSVFPPEVANSSFATWNEPVTLGQISARVADGVDFANQSKDSYHTFLAGVILGAAIGAAIAALQAALDANKPK
jgi:hypothetical protein